MHPASARLASADEEGLLVQAAQRHVAFDVREVARHAGERAYHRLRVRRLVRLVDVAELVEHREVDEPHDAVYAHGGHERHRARQVSRLVLARHRNEIAARADGPARLGHIDRKVDPLGLEVVEHVAEVVEVFALRLRSVDVVVNRHGGEEVEQPLLAHALEVRHAYAAARWAKCEEVRIAPAALLREDAAHLHVFLVGAAPLEVKLAGEADLALKRKRMRVEPLAAELPVCIPVRRRKAAASASVLLRKEMRRNESAVEVEYHVGCVVRHVERAVLLVDHEELLVPVRAKQLRELVAAVHRHDAVARLAYHVVRDRPPDDGDAGGRRDARPVGVDGDGLDVPEAARREVDVCAAVSAGYLLQRPPLDVAYGYAAPWAALGEGEGDVDGA